MIFKYTEIVSIVCVLINLLDYYLHYTKQINTMTHFQPTAFDDVSGQYNIRKLSELPLHLAEWGNTDDLEDDCLYNYQVGEVCKTIESHGIS